MNYKKIYLLILILFFSIIASLNLKEKFNNEVVKTFREGCFRGFYCPEKTDYRINCPSGHVCPDGARKVKCTPGSYCPGNPKVNGVDLEGIETPTRSYIEQMCPKGYYCPNDNGLSGTQAIRCNSGKVCCYRGETNREILTGSCKTNEEMKKLSDEKKLFVGSKGWRSRSSQYDCPGGYFCPTLASDPTKSSGQVIPCDSGMYCPPGSTEQQLCPAGYYCPVSNTMVEIENPNTGEVSTVDKEIPNGNKIKCKKGDYCPTGTTNITKRLCSKGHKCPKVKDLYGTVELKCDNSINSVSGEGGHYQNEEGKDYCKVCPNDIAANNNSTKCLGCPRGNYCTDLDSLPKKCDVGTYVHKNYTCTDTKICNPVSLNDIKEETAQFPNECFPCPKGQFQNKKGSIKCELCPKGTYQDERGKTSCKPCRKGEYQDREGGINCKKCEKGFYCSICNNIEDKDACIIQECHWNNSTKLCSQPSLDMSTDQPRSELSDANKDALRQKTISKSAYFKIKTTNAKDALAKIN